METCNRALSLQRTGLDQRDHRTADELRAELVRCRHRLQRAASLVSIRGWKSRIGELEAALAGTEAA